jgi:hypothetical protein
MAIGGPAAITDVEPLLIEACDLARWLAALAERGRESDPAIVEQVRRDYETRLVLAKGRLAGRAGELAAYLDGIDGRRARLVADRDEARSSAEEIELRHAVGEWTEAEHRFRRDAVAAKLDAAEKSLGLLEDFADLCREAIDASRPALRAPEPAAPEPAVPEPAVPEPAAPEPAAPVQAVPEPVLLDEVVAEAGGGEDAPEPEAAGRLGYTEVGPDELAALRVGETSPEDRGGSRGELTIAPTAMEKRTDEIESAPEPAMPEPIVLEDAVPAAPVAAPMDKSWDALEAAFFDPVALARIEFVRIDVTPEIVVGTAGEKGADVGSGRGCEVRIDDPSVAARHARVFHELGEFVIKDTGGREGVFLNGRRIARERIKAGDVLKLGKARLRVR